MGLLDMLFGGAQAPAQAGVAPPSAGLPPLMINQPQQLQLPSPTGGGQAVPDGGTVNEVTVTAHRQRPPTMTQPPPPPVQEPPGRVEGGYNNMDAVSQLGALQQKYAGVAPPADAPMTGLVGAVPAGMPGGGTLRNILGTLGDAFLVQSGHQPAYAQRMQREQLAHAAAGFDTDPMGAAARVAATAAPGSMQDAQTMFDAANNAQLRQAQQQANNEYRTGMLSMRQEATDSQVAARQAQNDDRTRSAIGGIMRAAAATGNPTLYAQARARAIQLGQGRIKDFDPDTEVPANLQDYSGGYGMSAGQVARNQTSQASIAERAQSSAAHVGAEERGQNMNAGNQAARTAAMLHGQDNSIGAMLNHYSKIQDGGGKLTASQQAIWDKYTHVNQGGSHLNIPGLTPGGGGKPAPTAQYSHTATGPGGKRMGWNGKQWVPIS